jgi:hypothetical protein
MNSLAKFFIAISFLLSVNAHAAGLLLEPILGYGMNTTTGTVKASGASFSTEANGLGLGARVGYILPLGLWFAGEYVTFLETDNKVKEPAGQANGKVSSSTAFLDVGFDLPAIPLRFWVGYAFMNSATVKSQAPDQEFTGTGYKLGVGYKAIPLLSINLEYIMNMHDKIKGSGIEMDVSNVYDGYKSSTIFLSVSVPFTPPGM